MSKKYRPLFDVDEWRRSMRKRTVDQIRAEAKFLLEQAAVRHYIDMSTAGIRAYEAEIAKGSKSKQLVLARG